MKKGVIAVISLVVLIAIVVIILALNSGTDNLSSENQNLTEEQQMQETGNSTTTMEEKETQEPVGKTYTIEVSKAGFSPSPLSISAGDTVLFEAIDSAMRRPASNLHPTHTQYPGSSIEKCGTDEADQSFDACKALQEGETYSFTFNEKGTWKYHDHRSPSTGGEIIVS